MSSVTNAVSSSRVKRGIAGPQREIGVSPRPRARNKSAELHPLRLISDVSHGHQRLRRDLVRDVAKQRSRSCDLGLGDVERSEGGPLRFQYLHVITTHALKRYETWKSISKSFLRIKFTFEDTAKKQ